MNRSSESGGGGHAAPLVSIIIPVFNATAAQIGRAVGSARAQTYRDLEVIVVDDGSDAAHAEFLDGLAQLDERVTVVHQGNAGVSAARNRGLADARGHYSCFLDADDALMPDFLSQAVRLLDVFALDIVFGGIQVESRIGRTQWRSSDTVGTQVQVLLGEDLDGPRAAALSSSPDPTRPAGVTLVTNVVGGLYDTGLARRVGFLPSVEHGEDRLFNVEALGAAHRVGFTSTTWYLYDRTQSDGVTQQLDFTVVTKLARTMEAFARVGGIFPDSLTPSPVLEQAAAQGILNYLKAAVLVLAADTRHRRLAVQSLDGLLAMSCTGRAAALLSTARQATFTCWLVRRRAARTLLWLGAARLKWRGAQHA